MDFPEYAAECEAHFLTIGLPASAVGAVVSVEGDPMVYCGVLPDPEHLLTVVLRRIGTSGLLATTRPFEDVEKVIRLPPP